MSSQSAPVPNPDEVSISSYSSSGGSVLTAVELAALLNLLSRSGRESSYAKKKTDGYESGGDIGLATPALLALGHDGGYDDDDEGPDFTAPLLAASLVGPLGDGGEGQEYGPAEHGKDNERQRKLLEALLIFQSLKRREKKPEKKTVYDDVWGSGNGSGSKPYKPPVKSYDEEHEEKRDRDSALIPLLLLLASSQNGEGKMKVGPHEEKGKSGHDDFLNVLLLSQILKHSKKSLHKPGSKSEYPEMKKYNEMPYSSSYSSESSSSYTPSYPPSAYDSGYGSKPYSQYRKPYPYNTDDDAMKGNDAKKDPYPSKAPYQTKPQYPKPY